ncbi:ceramide-1-phosphate transfer protein, partial [Trichomycterus rosablanca]|uniref:ceramide-1-phosphate transfer protein n=1 Tax=Trichomycterus rosablanca TaxID=2290929 RepID=UPI002F35D8F3
THTALHTFKYCVCVCVCVMMRLFLRQVFFLAAMLPLLIFLTSLWLPQVTNQNCPSSWLPCLTAARSKDPSALVEGSDVRSDEADEVISSERPITADCPGRSFQVSRLLLYLGSALGPESGVLIEPYLQSWEELVKFMEALGPMIRFFTYKVEEKIALIRQLAHEDSTHHPSGHAYHSVHSMLEVELQRGVVSFDREKPSGSRTLLRLHRSLLWLQLLLEKLWAGPGPGALSLGEACDEAYSEALARYHPWLLQWAARLAFAALPNHTLLLDMVCVTSHQEAEPIIRSIVTAIKEVRHRTHAELEKRNMLELP